jgi:hypothetical protein
MFNKIYIILFIIALLFILLGLLSIHQQVKDTLDNIPTLSEDVILQSEIERINNTVVNLILFYSEGPPNDNALNLTDTIKDVVECAKPHVNNIFIYTPQILKNLGYEKYVKDYGDLGEAKLNYGIQHIGFLGFRPLIFLLELEKMKDGEILVHRDVNYKKYPKLKNYENFKAEVLKYLKECNFDVFISREHEQYTLVEYCKTNVIRELGEDDDFVKHFPLLVCDFIIMRKSAITMELLREWLAACEKEEWINGTLYGETDQRYKFSTSEQCLVDVIIAKWIKKRKNNIPINYPDIISNRTITDILKPKNYDYLKYL